MKKSIIILCVALFLFVTPVTNSAAQTVSYQSRTKSETIAYLYGRIAMLLEVKALLEENGSLSSDSLSSLSGYVTIETMSAAEVEETEAVLRAEVIVYGSGSASVWFEYGRDEDFLDFKTSSYTINSLYERAVRTEVWNLESDKRYYYRVVAEDSETGLVTYGEIASFRTDEADEDE